VRRAKEHVHWGCCDTIKSLNKNNAVSLLMIFMIINFLLSVCIWNDF
jgi:hypothetical protein